MASGVYTHTDTHIYIHRISRNQARAGLWPACSRFKKNLIVKTFHREQLATSGTFIAFRAIPEKVSPPSTLSGSSVPIGAFDFSTCRLDL